MPHPNLWRVLECARAHTRLTTSLLHNERRPNVIAHIEQPQPRRLRERRKLRLIDWRGEIRHLGAHEIDHVAQRMPMHKVAQHLWGG